MAVEFATGPMSTGIDQIDQEVTLQVSRTPSFKEFSEDPAFSNLTLRDHEHLYLSVYYPPEPSLPPNKDFYSIYPWNELYHLPAPKVPGRS